MTTVSLTWFSKSSPGLIGFSRNREIPTTLSKLKNHTKSNRQTAKCGKMRTDKFKLD
jgi:hypothetical protein